MTPSARSLAQLQQWMLAVIVHPEGVAAGLASTAARAAIDVAPDEVEQVIGRSRALSSSERLEIYAGAYAQRLLECLRQEYAVLCKVLGEEVFDALACGYLQRYPSRSYTLGELGARFPEYLVELHAESPQEEEGSWPELIAELASFERLVREVFDGPGTEGQPHLSVEALGPLTAEQWSAARLVAAPCVRLAEFSHPVHSFFNAAKQADEPEPPEPRRSWVALTRREFVVRQFDLSEAQHALLAALLAGAPVGQAVAAAAALCEECWESLSMNVYDWFREWTAAGFFQRVELAAS
jgi:hypothetical protein